MYSISDLIFVQIKKKIFFAEKGPRNLLRWTDDTLAKNF